MTHVQLDITFARKARDKGIKKAIDSADRVSKEWSEKVYALFKEFLRNTKGEFMCENFRQYVSQRMPSPPSERAYGGIFMRAAKANLIQRTRYAPVTNARAHRCFASVWKRT